MDPADAGTARALVNTTEQMGGSLGVSLLNAVAASATHGHLASHRGGLSVIARAAVHGYTTAFSISALVLAGATAVALILLRAEHDDIPDELHMLPA